MHASATRRAGRACRLVAGVLLIVALGVPPLASAKARGKASPGRGYVTGAVSARGYTLLVVGYNGKVAASRAQHFRIAAPDSRVTLQLVDAHGRYAGPVVFASSRGRAITGVKVPVTVGTIDVIPARGYSHVAHPLARRYLDSARWAYAAHGVPIGNGLNLGLVTSKGRGGGGGPGQDASRVGVPNEFDVAVPGTHILKSLAPASLARAASAVASASDANPLAHTGAVEAPPPGAGPTPPPGAPPPPAGGGEGKGPASPSSSSPWMSQMFLAMNETLNDDAAGVTVAQIDATLQSKLNLKLLNVPTGASTVELNCNGLTYCSQGGTGQAALEGLAQNGPSMSTVPFPGGALDNADGFGEVVGPAVPSGMIGTLANGGHEFSLNPDATSEQIGSGDVITELVTEGGVTSQLPTTIDFVFNTVPAIASYSDTGGDTGSITYPDSSSLGTMSNPLKVAGGPSGDVIMTFTIYRPQRQGVPGAGEPTFMDIGHLAYELDSAVAPGPGSTTVGSAVAPQCPASSYSNPSPTLSLETGGSGEHSPPPGDGAMVDSAEDAPANAANTISFTVSLTQCLAAKGVSSFATGQRVQFDLSANSQSSSDHANQTFVVERVR